jgi:glycosyltransferase involved in cell wall biosynthesis
MANGVVVIGSELESFKKIIVNYENGVLCKPKDIEKFAKSIERIFINRSEMIKIMEKGVATVKNQTIESMHKERAEIISNYFEN